jgi:hypothetical protein
MKIYINFHLMYILFSKLMLKFDLQSKIDSMANCFVINKFT